MLLKPRFAFAAILVVLAGCGGGATSTGVPGPAVATPTATSTTLATSTATVAPSCPFPERGGTCLGLLAGGVYRTRSFAPRITYSVPNGWLNVEDLPTMFLLVPPVGTVEGVDADTGDFIGIYRGVAAANPDCTAGAQKGVGQSSADLAAWLRAHPGLLASAPRRVVIGGISGLVIDLRLDPKYRGTCPYVQDGSPVIPLLFGVQSAGVEHGIHPSFTTRLYLLDSPGPNTVVEVVDHPGGTGTADYARIVQNLRFG